MNRPRNDNDGNNFRDQFSSFSRSYNVKSYADSKVATPNANYNPYDTLYGVPIGDNGSAVSWTLVTDKRDK